MILKPFSNKMEISYRDFLNQNYFIVTDKHELKKVNLKGINSISSANDPLFEELNDNKLILRKFDSFAISPSLLSENDKPKIAETVKSRLEKDPAAEDNDISFTKLGAAFSIEMFDIIWIFETDSKDMHNVLEVLKDSCEFCGKGEQFDNCVTGIRNYYDYLKNPTDFSKLSAIKADLEKCIAEYEGNPFAHFIMGLIYHRPTQFFDTEKSFSAFTQAKKFFSELECKNLTAHCDFMLGWLSYVKNDIDSAIKFTSDAVNPEIKVIPEILYNLAKYYASIADKENALKYLDEVLMKYDFLYALKADIDDDFSGIKDDLLKFFERKRDEEKSRLISQLSELGVKFPPKKDQPV